MGGRRVLEGALIIIEVVVLDGGRGGRRTGVSGLTMSMQRALHTVA